VASLKGNPHFHGIGSHARLERFGSSPAAKPDQSTSDRGLAVAKPRRQGGWPAGMLNCPFGHFCLLERIQCAGLAPTAALVMEVSLYINSRTAKFWGLLGRGTGASIVEGLWRGTLVDPYRPTSRLACNPGRVHNDPL
jgi:hypothetical protein